jgi:Rps23 Pro-64 3,4-dihydroxylase Tpa1-like proline 4-hydroxylase
MLNLNALSNSSLVDSPFKYSVINQVLLKDSVDALLLSFPQENYFRSTRNSGSDKTYNVVNNLLLKLGETSYNKEANLPREWQDLVTQLASKEYSLALSKLLAVDLSQSYLEITLKRYGHGDYISAHTDTENVKATHMIFLNDSWDDSWGGQLCFMDDNHKVFKRFLPLSQHSVAFVRSHNSWHSVDKIIEPKAERLAIQVAFWNIKDRNVLPGRIETDY